MREYTNIYKVVKVSDESENENISKDESPFDSGIEQVKEIKFFSDPKTVKKKTQSSITRFQLIFSGLICLLLKLTEIFTPQLYENINAYLERLFSW